MSQNERLNVGQMGLFSWLARRFTFKRTPGVGFHTQPRRPFLSMVAFYMAAKYRILDQHLNTMAQHRMGTPL